MKTFKSLLAGLSLSLLLVVGIAYASNEDTTEVDPIDSGNYEENTDSTCNGDTHEHIHYNNSTDTGSRMFIGVVHKFAIVFDDDFMDSVDTTTMTCTDGDDTYRDCGFNKTTDLGDVVYSTSNGHWNGVTVTYQTLDWIDGNPKGLLWEYATDSDADDYDDNPWIGSGGQKVEGISFQADDYTIESTATTTSWTEMEFFYTDPDGDYMDTDNWHHIYTDDVQPYHNQVDPDNDYIYWYGINGTGVSNFPPCFAEEITCASLSISPETGDLDMSDVFSDVAFTVTATGSDGSNITGDSEFTYSVNQYGSANDASDANGTVRYGLGGISRSKNPTTTDSTVNFNDTEPGDSLYVYVSDYEGDSYESTCFAEVVLPYCTDLTITDPTGFLGSSHLGLISGTEYSSNIDITTDTSSGESWPFEVTYESDNGSGTFDGNSSPYTTTDTSIANYSSTESDTVTVRIDPDYDVANACSDSFDYTLYSIEIPTCADLTITTPTAPITVEAMEDGDVEISWVSTLSDGTPNPSTYVCTSSNATGQFRDSAGMTGTGMISTTMTTVYYTGEPGDTITCMSTTPYSGAACIDTITSQTDTTPPVCEDLSLGNPYVTADDGVTNVAIDLTSQSSLETLYADDTVCFPFDVSVESGFSGTLQATGYTDSTRATLSSGLLSLNVTSGGSYVGNPATVGISGATNYTGTLCWENYDENYVLDLEVVGSESVCAATVTLPPIEDTPPNGDDDDDDNGDDDDDLYCDDVVDVNDTDDSQICEEYSMEVCVETDDIEVISSGDEICYYDQDDTDHSDEIDCDTGTLEIPGDDDRECYDVVIEGNVCSGTISVEYPDSDGEIVCFDDSPEQAEVGVLNKFIYTFNFISGQTRSTEEDVFFTHDEDRTFYTLEYEPSGAEETVVFTDEMWNDEGIEGVIGDSNDEDSNGHVKLAKDIADLTDYEYEYTTIKAFGFGEEYETGSAPLEADVLEDFNDGSYKSFVVYQKYENGSPSERVDACAPSENEEGETEYGVDGLLCYNPEYVPEDDGKVVILNADTIDAGATLRIRYVGVVESGITSECDDTENTDDCLTEVFLNTAQVFADPADIDDVEMIESDDCDDDHACSEDSSRLVVLCAYLMTQNAGDIYLEGDLNSGSDISCAYIDEDQNYSSYSNTDGLVILDAGNGDDDDDDDADAADTSTTYYDSSYSSVSVCDSDETADNFIGNLSSYVCEIVSAVSELWKSETVSTTTDSHVDQAVRNADTAHIAGTSESYDWNETLANLTNANNPDSGILYFEGEEGGSTTLTLSGDYTVPCGAWTLIVKHADLHIASNIQYESACSNGKNYTTDLPSIAFVVEDGDIYVEDTAYNLVGVYYTDQSIDGDERSAVNGSLEIDGSIYGDIGPLLIQANYVGPPTLDGGSVVVRYDSRILLNTPPGLSEYVDVTTQKGVN